MITFINTHAVRPPPITHDSGGHLWPIVRGMCLGMPRRNTAHGPGGARESDACGRHRGRLKGWEFERSLLSSPAEKNVFLNFRHRLIRTHSKKALFLVRAVLMTATSPARPAPKRAYATKIYKGVHPWCTERSGGFPPFRFTGGASSEFTGGAPRRFTPSAPELCFLTDRRFSRFLRSTRIASTSAFVVRVQSLVGAT